MYVTGMLPCRIIHTVSVATLYQDGCFSSVKGRAGDVSSAITFQISIKLPKDMPKRSYPKVRISSDLLHIIYIYI